jgi:cell division protein FtsB
MLLRAIKNRLRAMLPPVIFLAITYYFGWNAVHGARGLEAQRQEQVELAKAITSFQAVDATRADWEAQVAALNSQSIGQDMLDQQARLVLNLAEPSDLVVQLPAK